MEFADLDKRQLALQDPTAKLTRSSWRVVFGGAAQPESANLVETFSGQPSSILAHVDQVDECGVSGWAYDEAAPLEPVTLALHIDEEHIGDCVCDLLRPDVKASGHPTDCVGFGRPIPLRFFDSLPHRIGFRDRHGLPVKAVFQGREQSQFTLKAVEVLGRVDGLHAGAIRGWAVRREPTGEVHGSLQVLVTMQGQPVAQITAGTFRADVAKAHDCDPKCGFVFHPPAKLAAGRTVEFAFRVIPGGHELPGSPMRVNFPSMEMVAALRDLQEDTDRIFTKLWNLRDHLRRLAPPETCTVEQYDSWARDYQKALQAAPNRLDGLIPANQPPPLVSIICPTYRPRLPDFTAAVESVRAQTWPHWELIIVDDASGSAELRQCVTAFRKQDKRIKAITLKQNSGISAATNAAMAQAKGRYVALFDHDDLLSERAIEFMLAAALRSGAQVLYSDEDKIDDNGLFSEPNFKPDWNYRLLLSQNYVCHLLFVERTLAERVGPFRSECDGAQDHDFILRLVEKVRHDRIEHVPEVLYHWRKTPTSTASSGEKKTYAVTAGLRAVQDHLDRRKLTGRVVSPRNITCFAIDWQITKEPSVVVIIPYWEHIGMTRACVEALQRNTTYTNYRIMLVDNWSTSDEALAFAEEMRRTERVSVLRVEEPFNYSRLNNLAVAASDSELLLFMNNDVFVSEPGWLRCMVGEMLADTSVGIVGNKLLYPNGRVQHGGVILGVGGVADHAYRGLPADEPGYMARAICAQELSAVTAACMLCRRDVFTAVGGFDEVDLQVAFNDVDLCLKVRQQGYRIIWTPSSVAEHRESLSRGDDMRPDMQPRFFHENEVMNMRWKDVLPDDKFYHRAFSRLSGIFTDLGSAKLADVRCGWAASLDPSESRRIT